MQLPIGKISGEKLEAFFLQSIDFHIKSFNEILMGFEKVTVFNNIRNLVRSTDELINIPLELYDATECENFLKVSSDFSDAQNLQLIKSTCNVLEIRFGKDVSKRFKDLFLMSFAINGAFSLQGTLKFLGGLNLYNIENSIAYFQSRRIYLGTTLNLVSKISKGQKDFPYIDTINQILPGLEACLLNITTAYYNLVLNKCLPDFEMESNGKYLTGNYKYKHLENFFLEPERLSLIDQLEFRRDLIGEIEMLETNYKKIFSFAEVANAMKSFQAAFKKYNIDELKIYKELNLFLVDIAVFVVDDYEIVLDKYEFNKINNKYKLLQLYLESDLYFDNLNSYAPFQKSENNYYSTVVLLQRFIYRALTNKLLKNRSFQINSGFVFEDRVSEILKEKGFLLTEIVRIDRREFDVITIKNNIVYNFQCKNNFIDISTVNLNYKLIARNNNRLCKYYEKSLLKEEEREHLIKKVTGIEEIKHFVVSRFPVISRNPRIINFNELNEWTLD